MHRVVIVGGGFGGLYAAKALARAEIQVTLIDRANFHLFQPLLYQVATGGLSPGDIASPLRAALKRQSNARVLMAGVAAVDPAARRVVLQDGGTEPYDTLVVAAGLTSHYFGHPEWAARAPGLKSMDDALEIRRRVLCAFEAAEREPDPARRRAWLTFLVVGGGATGVELAGALAELAHFTLRREYRTFDPRRSRIALVEGGSRLLADFHPSLSKKAQRTLERLGVDVVLDTLVTTLDDDGAILEHGGKAQHLAARTLLWAAGVRGAPLGQSLAGATGCPVDELGRLMVAPDLSIPGHPEIFVIGDLARVLHRGEPIAAVAPAAMQQGRYVASLIRARLARRPARSFRYHDKGKLATVGRGSAVGTFGRLRFAGLPAWLLWLFVHLLYLIEFENRLLVLIQWANNYFTRHRGSRLVTGEGAVLPPALGGGGGARRRRGDLDPDPQQGAHVGFVADEGDGAREQREADAVRLHRPDAGQEPQADPAIALRER